MRRGDALTVMRRSTSPARVLAQPTRADRRALGKCPDWESADHTGRNDRQGFGRIHACACRQGQARQPDGAEKHRLELPAPHRVRLSAAGPGGGAAGIEHENIRLSSTAPRLFDRGRIGQVTGARRDRSLARRGSGHEFVQPLEMRATATTSAPSAAKADAIARPSPRERTGHQCVSFLES